MTQNKPQLFLNRLVITTKQGSVAFDEIFHKGVNIIRGENSSGKSTIANFIFYVLGGDFQNWTSEAYKCSEVIAEIELTGAKVTVKRQVKEVGQQPLYIYWGAIESAMTDNLNWQVYPYRQTENQTSFSNVIFKALNIPEVRSEADSNITMHQLLRLMYIDQDTPTQNLFRIERFDLPLTRQVVSEVLLGVYDDLLYKNRLLLRSAIKQQEEKKQEYDGIFRVFKEAGATKILANINNQLDTARAKSQQIDLQIITLRSKQKINTNIKTALDSEKIQIEFTEVKNNISNVQSEINSYEVEISDSVQFISTLEKRLVELEHSLLTRKVFGELPLTHCPQCLTPLEQEAEENHCMLCKQKLPEDIERANAKRLRQELEIQLKESQKILELKRRHVAELNGTLPGYIEKGRLLQKQLDNAIASQQSTRDQTIDKLIFEKGSIEKEIEFLTEQLKVAELLELLKNELAHLASVIQNLRAEIVTQEQIQANRYDVAMTRIRQLTLKILNNDLDRQSEFKSGRHVEVDFLKDIFALDGSNNFSASSKVYFKNAILFAIFFASLELDFFRYPRFILCDNMEDKGMEKERTQNFQSVITKMSAERSNKPHQIIFTTSMIADTLNNTPYCVGKFYNRNEKSLKV